MPLVNLDKFKDGFPFEISIDGKGEEVIERLHMKVDFFKKDMTSIEELSYAKNLELIATDLIKNKKVDVCVMSDLINETNMKATFFNAWFTIYELVSGGSYVYFEKE